MDARPLKKLILAIAAPAFLLSGCSSSNVPSGTSLEGNQPASIQLLISPTTTLAGGSTVNVVAVVLDGNGNPVPDATPVQFSLAPSASGVAATAGGTITGTGSTIDGQATATYTSGGGPGEVIVEVLSGTVLAKGLITVITGTVSVAPVTAEDATATLGTIRVIGSATTIPADGSSTVLLTATLVDSDGASDTQGAKQVVFQTDLGVLRMVGSSTISRQITVTTDGNGQAQAVLVASNNPGVATVTASAEGIEGLLTVSNFGRPASIILDTENLPNPDPPEIAVTGSGRQENSTVFFRVLDSNGSPVLANATRTVEFMILNGGLAGGERLSPGTGVGAAITNGLAKTVVRSGTRAGTIKVIGFIQTPTVEGTDLITTIGTNTVSSAALAALPAIAAGAPALQLKILFGPDEGTYRILAHTAGATTATLQTLAAGGVTLRASSTGIPFRVDNGRLDPGEVATNAIEIGITGDLPSGENFSIFPEVLNIAGRVRILTGNVTAYLADRFNNSVPEGTSVNFTTYDEANLGSAAQVLGAEKVTQEESQVLTVVRSQDPVPSEGFVKVEAQSQSGFSAHVRSLVVDNSGNPATGDSALLSGATLFAGTDGGGVFRSPNPNQDTAGVPNTQWIQAGRGSTGLFDGIINDLAIDPLDPSLVFAATDNGVFRTISAGEIWDDASGRGSVVGDTPTVTITCVDATGETVNSNAPPALTCPAGARVGNVSLLLNFTSSTRRSKTVISADNQLTTDYDYSNPRRIELFNVPCDLFSPNSSFSVDYELGDPLPSDVPVKAVVINPDPVAVIAGPPGFPTISPRVVGGVTIDTKIVYAGILGRGFWRSTDGGFTWNREIAGLDNQNVQCLVYDPVNDVLYAGTLGGGVYRSTVDDRLPVRDVNGQLLHSPLRWVAINGANATSLLFKDVRTIRAVPAGGGDNVLVVGTRLGGVWLAYDDNLLATPVWAEAGTNIQDVSTLIINTTVTELAYKPATVGAPIDEIFAAAIDDDDPQNTRGGVFRGTLTLANPPTLVFGTAAAEPGFSDGSTTLENKRVRAIDIDFDVGDLAGDGVIPVLYAGTDGRNVYRKRLTTVGGTSDPADSWALINDRQSFFTNNAGAFPDFSLPASIRNEIYSTTTLLFSGITTISVEQIADTLRVTGSNPQFLLRGPIQSVGNETSQIFAVTLSDDFGNPLVAGSNFTVTSTGGTLAGDIQRTIVDSLRGQTEFFFTLTNNAADDTIATININVTSPNGAATVALTRSLVGPVTVAGSGTQAGSVQVFRATNGTNSGHYQFSVSGGTVLSATADTVTVRLPALIDQTVTVNAVNVSVGESVDPASGANVSNGTFDPCNPEHYGNRQEGTLTFTTTG